jgi:hypothetical protein
MPMPYPEKTNVGVLVNVQRRFNENLRPETVLWLAEVIQAGLLAREHGGSTRIELDEENGVITIVSGRSPPVGYGCG